jgi:SecD/SecF fusion protein
MYDAGASTIAFSVENGRPMGRAQTLNLVLARCIFTSLTTLLTMLPITMLPMAIWGGPALASFAIPMRFGVVIATFSSIFIAAPILLFLEDWRAMRRAADAALDLEVDVDAAMAPHVRAGR